MHQPIEVLGAMITPAVLISAAALLLLSTASRLGRVNDRLQHLLAEMERVLPHASSLTAGEQKRHLSLQQLNLLHERLTFLRSAVTGLYMTIALLVITSITSGLYVLVPQVTSITPISVGMLGSVAFLYSIAQLICEASIAARMTTEEIAYIRDLLTQRDHCDFRRQAG
jgi:Protein of unknown function (DUF2721)